LIPVACKGSTGVGASFFEKPAIINRNPTSDPFYKTAKVEAWCKRGDGVHQ
jgi:hypothetical protein